MVCGFEERECLDCLFSGEATENEEHVIPAWMQRRFNLWQQKIIIPNGTSLQYRFVKVGAAERHNAKFGEIENRISRGIYDPQEVYLWALKIHIGFLFRDATLKADRSKPDSDTVWKIDDFESEIVAFQTLFKVWSDGGSISPNPFGSVFILDALTPEPAFDFIHDVWSGTVLFQLGLKLIFVSLWDQSDGLSANLLEGWEKYHQPFVKSQAAEDRQIYGHTAHHVWACDSAYWLWRQRRRFNFVRTPQSFALIPPATRKRGLPASEAELSSFCKTFGLSLTKFNGEVSNAYTLLTLDDVIKRRGIPSSEDAADST